MWIKILLSVDKPSLSPLLFLAHFLCLLFRLFLFLWYIYGQSRSLSLCAYSSIRFRSWDKDGMKLSDYTLKNKGASRCQKNPFVSMVPYRTFNIWRTFVSQKALYGERMAKESQTRDDSLKNLWLNCSLWNQKWLFMALLEEWGWGMGMWLDKKNLCSAGWVIIIFCLFSQKRNNCV